MPVIYRHSDPADIRAAEVFQVPARTLLLDWLISVYGPNGFHVPTQVYVNQELVQLEEHIDTGLVLNVGDVVHIVERPQGLDPITIFAIALVFTVAMVLLIPKVPIPTIPELEKLSKSPNNNLSGQTNVARALQRIPDIYGQNRVYPDLIVKTYFEYIGYEKYQTEYLCIGRGAFLVESIKSGDTLISTIAGSSAQVFEPFTRPDVLYDVTPAEEINGQTLLAPNEPLDQEVSVKITTTSSGLAIKSFNPSFGALYNLSAGDTFEIFVNVVKDHNLTGIGASGPRFSGGDTITSPNSTNTTRLQSLEIGEVFEIYSGSSAGNNGFYVVSGYVVGGIVCLAYAGLGSPGFTDFGSAYSCHIRNNTYANMGVYTIDSTSSAIVGGNVLYNIVVTSGNTFTANTGHLIDFKILTAASISRIIGPYTLKTKPQEVWIDLSAPRGLKNAAAAVTIEFDIDLIELDSGGSPVNTETYRRSIYGNTIDERNVTLKMIPANVGASYSAQVTRVTNSLLDSSKQDLVKITRLASVRTIDVTDFGDVTTVLVLTKATPQATSQSERRFNAVVTRKLKTYAGSGAMTSTLFATVKFADAFVHMLTDPKMGNKSLAQIDLEGIYALQTALDADSIYGTFWGRFCYTFSDARVSVKDELKTICNAVRAFYYQDGLKTRVSRDQAQTTPLALFNRRNTRPSTESRGIKFRLPSDYDGVTFEYSDQMTGDAATIEMPEDLSATNPLKIQGAGIKNYKQAWNRAKYEYNKIRLRRVSVDKEVTRAGLLVAPNDLVMNADGTNLRAQNGEIISVVGTSYETNEPLDFDGQSTGSLVFTDDKGAPSVIFTVTPRSDSINGFIKASGIPAGVYTRAGDATLQVGSLYNFSPHSQLPLDKYLVQEMAPGADGYVKLTLINYDAGVYAQDTETPT